MSLSHTCMYIHTYTCNIRSPPLDDSRLSRTGVLDKRAKVAFTGDSAYVSYVQALCIQSARSLDHHHDCLPGNPFQHPRPAILNRCFSGAFIYRARARPFRSLLSLSTKTLREILLIYHSCNEHCELLIIKKWLFQSWLCHSSVSGIEQKRRKEALMDSLKQAAWEAFKTWFISNFVPRVTKRDEILALTSFNYMYIL